MIHATLARLALLDSAPPAIREAARLLAAAVDSDGLPEGRSRLGPFDLTVSLPDTAKSGELPFEAHRRFVDLQLVLEGAEGYELARIADCVVTRAYDAEAEAEFYSSAAAASHFLVLAEGEAVVFFTEDAHKPRIAVEGSTVRLRKAVVKIPLESIRRD